VRILCPSDGSPRASAAIDKVVASYSGDGNQVDLLVVVPARRGREPSAGRRAHLEDYLSGEGARLEAAGFDVTITVRDGHAADEIVAAAEATEPDLVVLGARTPDGAGPGYSGRVAGGVARHVQAPVLIARDGGPVSSVVLGYDESPDADAALGLVARLPYSHVPKVAVCSAYEVGEDLLPASGPDGDEPRMAHLEDIVEARHAADLIAADAAARLRIAGLPSSAHAVHGRASRGLEILAAELDADLIAVGSRGLSGVQRFLLGSTSDELVSTARTSVLIVRS
jgi:nucleotide-binding universal stress UspA family protein